MLHHLKPLLLVTTLLVSVDASSGRLGTNPSSVELMTSVNSVFLNAPFVALNQGEIVRVLSARDISDSVALVQILAEGPQIKRLGGGLFASAQVYRLVEKIAHTISIFTQVPTAPFAPDAIIKAVEDLIRIKGECKADTACADQKISQGLPETERAVAEQIYTQTPAFAPQAQHAKAIRTILAAKKPVVLFEGVPGSGKTASALTWIIATLRTLGHQIHATAPNAGGYAALQGDFKKTPEVVKAFGDVLAGNVPEGSFLVIDEVYLTAMEDLDVLFDVAAKKKLKLIFSGDSLQNLPNSLPIVGLFDTLPVVHLYDSNRASEEGHKQFAGTMVRDSLSAALHNFSNNIFVLPKEEAYSKMMTHAVNAIKKAKDDMASVLFVVPEDDLFHVNRAFHQKLEDEGMVQGALEVKVAYPDYDPTTYQVNTKTATIRVGRGTRLFMKAGNEAMGITQGAMGMVEKIEGDQITINFGISPVVIDTKTFNHFDYAYALTSASSQGMSVPHVYVLLDKEMSVAQVYVALTRHKKTIEIYAPKHAFASKDLVMSFSWSDTNKAALSRMKTVLADILKGKTKGIK